MTDHVVPIKINARQRRVLAAVKTRALLEGAEWSKASDVATRLWRDTPDPDDRQKLPTANGCGKVLAHLHKLGLLERRWADFYAVWEYRVTWLGHYTLKRTQT